MRARAANTALFRGALRGRPAGRAHPGPAGARGGDRWIAGSPDRWIPGSPDRAEPTPPAPAHRGPARPGPPAAPSGAAPGPRAQQRLFHPAPPARHVPDRGAGGAARRGSCRRGGDAVTVTGARREGKAASPRGGGAASLPAPSPAAPGRARPALGTSRLPHGPAPAPAALPGGSGHAGRAASIRERARGGAAAGAERAGPRREPSPHRGGSQGCIEPARSQPRAHGVGLRPDGSGIFPLRETPYPLRVFQRGVLPRARMKFPVLSCGLVFSCRSRRMERLS